MPILTSYTFDDLIKPRKLRLVRGLNSGRMSQFKYATENNFTGAGLGVGIEYPIEEFSRMNRWVKISIPNSSGPNIYLKLTEDEVKGFFHLSI